MPDPALLMQVVAAVAFAGKALATMSDKTSPLYFLRPMPLLAASRAAHDESVGAIRRSLRLLRQPIYPADVVVRRPSIDGTAPTASEQHAA